MIVKMCKHGGNVVPNKLPNKSFIGGILKMNMQKKTMEAKGGFFSSKHQFPSL